jgi:hypothetical protein
VSFLGVVKSGEGRDDYAEFDDFLLSCGGNFRARPCT